MGSRAKSSAEKHWTKCAGSYKKKEAKLAFAKDAIEDRIDMLGVIT